MFLLRQRVGDGVSYFARLRARLRWGWFPEESWSDQFGLSLLRLLDIDWGPSTHRLPLPRVHIEPHWTNHFTAQGRLAWALTLSRRQYGSTVRGQSWPSRLRQEFRVSYLNRDGHAKARRRAVERAVYLDDPGRGKKPKRVDRRLGPWRAMLATLHEFASRAYWNLRNV